MALADMRVRLAALLPTRGAAYTALPENVTEGELRRRTRVWADRHRSAVKLTLTAMILAALGFFFPALSHSWGQYSPFYSVPSRVSPATPAGCAVTFAQLLSRHGARDPTASKTAAYAGVVARIRDNATSYGRHYEFIERYNYTLGADQLTAFGQQELVNSGLKFYHKYRALADRAEQPFVRASGEDRVVESARNWTQGFYGARAADRGAEPLPGSGSGLVDDILVISEDDGSNNTLNHGTCTAFEESSDTGGEAQAAWAAIFVPPIAARVNANLPGAELSDAEVVELMDLCPFDTVARAGGAVSPFCGLFDEDEWHSYDYYQSLGKWYGYGAGHALGPTQGVGWVNELVARLTGRPVADRTTTNATLDGPGPGAEATFPLGRALYADFSHDNTMTSIYAALGLYNATRPLSRTAKSGPGSAANAGYSASWTVPFAARMYVEKMTCGGGGEKEDDGGEEEEEEEELVRILVNDRVMPLQTCGADELGRCTLSSFMVSAAGTFFIVLFVLLIAAAIGWVVFTQLRARRLGVSSPAPSHPVASLPAPPLSSYNPFARHESSAYATSGGGGGGGGGGVWGRLSDKVRGFRGGRNARSAAGAYEAPSSSSRRGFGALDPDDAWDARVGNEDGAGGYYGAGGGGGFEEQELGLRGRSMDIDHDRVPGAGAGGDVGAYSGGGYATTNLNVSVAAPPAEERGRTMSRSPGVGGDVGGGGLYAGRTGGRNPFDDEAEPSNLSMRGVSPRPIDTSGARVAAAKKTDGVRSGDSPTSAGTAERRSIFRENV
ncbi:phosphoglycerate mutase-like protein [Xylariaceae sp. FL0804]|nr:phosphoglycerate mutase-like protein [Xylariaceae sp. FL0804]